MDAPLPHELGSWPGRPDGAPVARPGPVPRVRALRDDDLPAVLDLHLATFPDNVMGRFGRRLLRAYYRTFLTGPDALALVATDASGRPLGYLVGVLATARHRRWVRTHHRGELILAALPAFMSRPRLAAGMVRRRLAVVLRSRVGDRSATPGAVGVPGPIAVLSHVAVAPAARGAGLGEALVARFEDAAEESGAALLCLATVDGGRAAALYERRGWRATARRRTFDGRTLRLYERVPA